MTATRASFFIFDWSILESLCHSFCACACACICLSFIERSIRIRLVPSVVVDGLGGRLLGALAGRPPTPEGWLDELTNLEEPTRGLCALEAE